MTPGRLYVVATPLGNLEDVTLRALRVLKEVALIAAEDTRQSRKLLDRYDIRTPLTSYYDQIERRKAPELIRRLLAGGDVALVSDAGTPCIADPGYRLVRAAIKHGITVVPVPGASAVAAALSAGGLPTDRFAFEGFVPSRSAARRAFFATLRGERRTIVCFEAARRLTGALDDLVAEVGDCEVVVAREVTKLHEEFLRGRASEVRARLGERKLRGEVTLLVSPRGSGSSEGRASEPTVLEAIARLRAEGLGLKETSRRLASETGWPAREVYGLAVGAERARE
jgi:16S rRNA (cytidine1402-2'-O)-methyltransferase